MECMNAVEFFVLWEIFAGEACEGGTESRR